MTPTAQQARVSMQVNFPPVESGQRWRLDPDGNKDYPNEIRIVCRYPFVAPADGRTWIFESAMSFEHLERIPELTLRQLYKLTEEVS